MINTSVVILLTQVYMVCKVHKDNYFIYLHYIFYEIHTPQPL